MSETHGKEPENPPPFEICVIVFKHPDACFSFSPFWDDYLYYIEDDRLNDQKLWFNKKAFAEIFTTNIFKADKSHKTILVIDYNPLVAICLKGFMERVPRPKPTKFFCFAFFHDDITLGNIITEFDDNTTSEDFLLDVKFSAIESMIKFPFIKKYEIPIGFEISAQYLAERIDENMQFAINSKVSQW